MNVRLVTRLMLALLLASYAYGQQVPRSGDELSSSVSIGANASDSFKQDLAHRISVEEAVLHQAESTHATDVDVARICAQLGLLYEDAARWERAETVLEHSVSLFRHTLQPSGELAVALSRLGSLHVWMGKLGASEKEEQEALKLRQSLGDRLQAARSWNDLAALSLSQRKFEKARDFGQQAIAEFVANEKAEPFDRISARYTLSMALCSLKESRAAIPLLKDALDEAKKALFLNDFPIGFGDFLLGYAYWKSGNMSDAGQYMQEGVTAMNQQLGWGHPAYLKVLTQYAKFLRENQQLEAANVVERRIRQAEAVVDVHSMQTGQGMFSFEGRH